jgi:inositol transport system substrate-binding protein
MMGELATQATVLRTEGLGKTVSQHPATADGLAEMEKGNLDVTVFQDAKGQGKGAVETAVKLIKGEKVESFVWIPFELVTADNYKEYLNK